MSDWIEKEDGCWEWQGHISSEGYGTLDGRSVYAHRWAYEHFVGPIPEGLTIDHLCRNRRCVNPKHLEPVTMRENLLRGMGAPARNARKTHCKHGHEFTQENTYYNSKGRACRECHRELNRRWWHKRKAAQGV